jgi:putative transcriptional regulator
MRDLPSKKRRSLAGSLLVAHPNMSDPNFRRTVLLISAHGPDEGALGVILNRPLDKHVSEIVTEPAPECLGEVPVFLGGPVGKNQLMFATFEWQKSDGLKIKPSVSFDEASATAGNTSKSLYAFIGYAGWSAGQLEAELKEKAWVLQKPSRALLKPDEWPRLWFNIMNRLGPWYKLLAAAPDDPSLN